MMASLGWIGTVCSWYSQDHQRVKWRDTLSHLNVCLPLLIPFVSESHHHVYVLGWQSLLGCPVNYTTWTTRSAPWWDFLKELQAGLRIRPYLQVLTFTKLLCLQSFLYYIIQSIKHLNGCWSEFVEPHIFFKILMVSYYYFQMILAIISSH